jgi:CRISPR-associated protein Cmx8
MAETKSPQIVLTLEVDDLPTAQHRAGLAGLLLQVRSMQQRRLPPAAIPRVSKLSATSVELTLTSESVQGVMDDLYEARVAEVTTKSKWPGTKPLREEMVRQTDPETGKPKSVKQFVYPVVQPTSPVWEQCLQMPADHPWLKLWRDMIWSVPRGIYLTRVPFNQRSRREPCSEGDAVWQALVADARLREKGSVKTEEISSALMLSAQAFNAEAVPFVGRVDQNLLLHFWQVVTLSFVPQFLDIDGQYQHRGFVLAIPDVCDLRGFCEVFPLILHDDLGREKRGFRPADALIDIPAQANLEFLRHLKSLAASKAGGEQWSGSVRAVESFHMQKTGNTIKLLAFERVANRPALIREYERLNQTYRNPLFRSAVLRGLLHDEPWYSMMVQTIAERPWPMFVESEKTPRKVPRFGKDARKNFKAISEDTQDMKTDEMSEDQALSTIIQRLIYKYVEGRAEAKTGKKVKDFKTEEVNGKKRRIYPKEFREAQQRVCSDVFLAMRSRHDQDFVEYFVGSICSVAQYLPATDYQFLTSVLLTRSDPTPTASKKLTWEDVKAVAMVAVSACSYATQPREDQQSRSSS